MKRGGVRLRAWLKKNGLTQRDLGVKLGTHQTNVSAWILGRPIPVEMAVAIEKLTKIPVEDWTVPADEARRRPSLPPTGTG